MGVEVHIHVFLNFILDGDEDSLSQPGIFARGMTARIPQDVGLAMNFRYVLMSWLQDEAEPTVWASMQ